MSIHPSCSSPAAAQPGMCVKSSKYSSSSSIAFPSVLFAVLCCAGYRYRCSIYGNQMCVPACFVLGWAMLCCVQMELFLRAQTLLSPQCILHRFHCLSLPSSLVQALSMCSVLNSPSSCTPLFGTPQTNSIKRHERCPPCWGLSITSNQRKVQRHDRELKRLDWEWSRCVFISSETSQPLDRLMRGFVNAFEIWDIKRFV